MQELKEKVRNDEALRAKADQITGSGDELQQKIKDFAASLGYEIVEEAPGKMELDELDAVSGGSIFTLDKEEADFCGVELLKEDGTPGEYTWYHNFGDYYFHGVKIDTNEACKIYMYTRRDCSNHQYKDYETWKKNEKILDDWYKNGCK